MNESIREVFDRESGRVAREIARLARPPLDALQVERREAAATRPDLRREQTRATSSQSTFASNREYTSISQKISNKIRAVHDEYIECS